MPVAYKRPARTLPTALADDLRPYEVELLLLRHRWHAIEVFTKELHTASGGLQFDVHGQAAWQWMFDARDMMVIDLGSWVKSLWEPGGLLGTLGADGTRLRQLRPKFPRGTHHNASVCEHRALAFARLFPGAKDYVRPPDLRPLQDAVCERLRPVWDDRSANRAHPYESDPKESWFHQNSELDEHLRYAEDVFNDLRLCAGAGVVAYSNHFGDSPEGAARDLVDAILLGGSDRIDMVTDPEASDGTTYRWQRRERFYATLRANAAGRPVDAPFNTHADIAPRARPREHRPP